MDFEVHEEIVEFLDNSSDKTKKLIVKKLSFFSERDKQSLMRSGDLKWLGDKVFEAIIGPWRLLGWLVDITLHLTVIFRKKSQRTPKRHINTAKTRGLKIESKIIK